MLDEPHISPFSKINETRSAKKVIAFNTQKNNKEKENLKDFKISQSNQTNPNNIEEAIFRKVNEILSKVNTQIKNVENNQFGQVYTVSNEVAESRFKLSYNSKNMITDITIINGDYSIANELKSLENQFVFFNDFGDNTEFDFPEEFLKDYYDLLLKICSNQNIQIIDIEHLPYMERYTFKQNDKVAIIDFTYNSKGSFTRTQYQRGTDINLYNFIKSLLK